MSGPRIGFLVERPTQFEAPFFRHASAAGGGELRVLFTRPEPAREVWDPELGRPVAWGIDLVAGYDSASAPAGGLARYVLWLRRELARRPLDLLVINGYTRRRYLAAALVARAMGLRTALRIDSVEYPGASDEPDGTGEPGERPTPSRARRLLVGRALPRLFDLFLTTGSLGRAYLERRGVAPERIGLLPYAVDVEHFRRGARLAADERRALRRRLGVPEEGPVVLALAKLAEREAPRDLVAAYAAPAPPPGHLLVAGDGPERATLEAAARGGGGGGGGGGGERRVTFAGYVPYPELPALYGAVDLFVHAPADEERWGVSVAEAMAAGLPVVASTRVGAAWDQVVPGENGFLYLAGDPAALGERIGRALALDRDEVAAVDRRVLERWDYRATWRGLTQAAAPDESSR